MSRRAGRLISTIVDIIATYIENAPVKLDEKKLSEVLGANPILPQILSGSKTVTGSHIATPPGVSEERYCYDCASKHLGTAKVLMREALQRAVKGEPKEAVLEKVRGAYEELMGAEDDTQSLSDERTREINAMIRDTRKWFYDSDVIVDTDKNKIAEALKRVDELNDTVYKELERRRARLQEFIGKTKQKLEQLEKRLQEESKQHAEEA
jgi:hypothetical protein